MRCSSSCPLSANSGHRNALPGMTNYAASVLRMPSAFIRVERIRLFDCVSAAAEPARPEARQDLPDCTVRRPPINKNNSEYARAPLSLAASCLPRISSDGNGRDKNRGRACSCPLWARREVGLKVPTQPQPESVFARSPSKSSPCRCRLGAQQTPCLADQERRG